MDPIHDTPVTTARLPHLPPEIWGLVVDKLAEEPAGPADPWGAQRRTRDLVALTRVCKGLRERVKEHLCASRRRHSVSFHMDLKKCKGDWRLLTQYAKDFKVLYKMWGFSNIKCRITGVCDMMTLAFALAVGTEVHVSHCDAFHYVPPPLARDMYVNPMMERIFAGPYTRQYMAESVTQCFLTQIICGVMRRQREERLQLANSSAHVRGSGGLQ